MASNVNYPAKYESWLTLKDGREIFLRPIMPTDEHLVIDLFNRLSSQSIYLRFLRQLHDLPCEMLYQFTHVNYNSEFALVGMTQEDDGDAIIAIARYGYTPQDNTTDLAIAVRDDWQHSGFGKSLLKRIVEIGKEHDIHQFSGMIDPQNRIIKQILLELGYDVNYTLRNGFLQVKILA